MIQREGEYLKLVEINREAYMTAIREVEAGELAKVVAARHGIRESDLSKFKASLRLFLGDDYGKAVQSVETSEVALEVPENTPEARLEEVYQRLVKARRMPCGSLRRAYEGVLEVVRPSGVK
jgi:hypothetical protein